MQYTVPQFIEHEAKIVWIFTFKQFIFLGIAAAISFMLYFSGNFFLFIVGTILAFGAALAFVFVKIGTY